MTFIWGDKTCTYCCNWDFPLHFGSAREIVFLALNLTTWVSERSIEIAETDCSLWIYSCPYTTLCTRGVDWCGLSLPSSMPRNLCGLAVCWASHLHLVRAQKKISIQAFSSRLRCRSSLFFIDQMIIPHYFKIVFAFYCQLMSSIYLQLFFVHLIWS